MIDLPAFGSKLKNFDNRAKPSKFSHLINDWKVQINFQSLNGQKSNSLERFWRSVFDKWRHYMKNESDFSSPTSIYNVFNYTAYIFKDLETFLKLYSESFLSIDSSKYQLPSLISKSVFEETKNTLDLKDHSYFDELLVRCSFQTNLDLSSIFLKGLKKKCGQYFQKTLTTNGICHSFNPKMESNIWRERAIIKAFEQAFNVKKFKNENKAQKFRGTGKSEGNAKTFYVGKLQYSISTQLSIVVFQKLLKGILQPLFFKVSTLIVFSSVY